MAESIATTLLQATKNDLEFYFCFIGDARIGKQGAFSRLLKPGKEQVVLDGKAVYGYPSTQLAQMLGLLPPVSNGTGGNHGGRFGRTWTISIPEVHAEYDQRGLCRS